MTSANLNNLVSIVGLSSSGWSSLEIQQLTKIVEMAEKLKVDMMVMGATAKK